MVILIAERKPVTTLPGEPVPYVIEAGSGRAHVLLGEVARALADAEESGGAMSVTRLDSPKSERPIPLHYHEAEREFLYCFDEPEELDIDALCGAAAEVDVSLA